MKRKIETILVLSLALLIACSDSPLGDAKPIAESSLTADQLKAAYFTDGIEPLLFDAPDSNYAVVPESWLIGLFRSSAWNAFRAEWVSVPRGDDCDDFTRAAVMFAVSRWRQESRDERAPAIGEFGFVRDAGGKHAVVTAWVGRRIYIEPQSTGEPLTELSWWEETTCEIAKF